ncbi:MAG: DEAD/DEAH box helicase [Ruminococcaceae bacterium]|nr:DEAD/DEAH box helicase [Oscillospiraceae bacterium]
MEKSFENLYLSSDLQRAVDDMGFKEMTDIQAKAIPLIRTGADVIGRSQTGTGKTVAFAIPALETLDTDLDKVQIIILCPTRELAMQGAGEIKKLSRFMHKVKVCDVYGGAAMDRQILKLKKANIVIGTPGRIMDHMRRKTLKLHDVKMVVLDEADEMLSMGFREDIEEILSHTPDDRQTVLFSATMPKEILEITEKFQREPLMIEIQSQSMTVEHIKQSFIEVPMGKKMDALNMLLRYFSPKRAMIFCNTKVMVEDLGKYLKENGFNSEGLHGDMQQSSRTRVMDSFKGGLSNILIATDVAARGIDVSDIDFVFNYDIPQNREYYVHRIGRTGRAGKEGSAVTICSGRRQIMAIKDIARSTKSEIEQLDLPSTDDLRNKLAERELASLKEQLDINVDERYNKLLNELLSEGISLYDLSAKLLQIIMGDKMEQITSLESFGRKKRGDDKDFCKIIISIGRNRRVAPNHIMCAIADRTGISGKEIGKIEIYDDRTIVGIPKDKADEIILKMIGCKINGHVVETGVFNEKKKSVKPEKQQKTFGKERAKQGKDKSFKQKKEKSFRKPKDKVKTKKKR